MDYRSVDVVEATNTSL